MKAKTAVKLLKELDPEESIVIAMWQKDAFEGIVKEDDDWECIAQSITDELDWGWVQEDMIQHIEKFQSE